LDRRVADRSSGDDDDIFGRKPCRLQNCRTFPRNDKQRIFAEILATLFEGRIYAFDEGAAREYAELMRERKALGRPMSKLDAQIAAIARVRKLAVATRDRDFDDCGIEVINPWDYAGT
jgi:toxin FitB